MTDKEKLVNLLVECYNEVADYEYKTSLTWTPDTTQLSKV